MALEAIPTHNDIFNFMVFETLNAAQYGCNIISTLESSSVVEKPQVLAGGPGLCSPVVPPGQFSSRGTADRRANLGVVQGRKRKRRRPKICKNKEEAETQRMTHITVERNRRKLMNEHLAVLRSLMPESYAQRGDQASIVGGAIDFVKELEHLVHSLEAQKLLVLQRAENMSSVPNDTNPLNSKLLASPFANLFSDSQLSFSEAGNKYTIKSKAPVADIEVTLIETHANIRILSKKRPRQLSKMVSGFQLLHLTILHLNVTSFDPLVLYSISAKVEEGCQLTSVDSISDAVHHMLIIIEEEDASSLLLTY